jgi:hypothetical protein
LCTPRVAGLVFLLDPASKPSPPAAKIAARITRVRWIGHLTLTEFHAVAASSQSAPHESEDEGRYYEIGLSSRGLRHQVMSVVWSLYDAATHTPVRTRTAWLHQVGATVTNPADSTDQLAKVWIPEPAFPGRFYALFEVDAGDATLDSARSRAFDGGAVQPPGPATRPTSTISHIVTIGARTKTRGCRRGVFPDPACSPGAYDSSFTKRLVCAPEFRTASRRLTGQANDAMRRRVLAEYGLDPNRQYGLAFETDHIIPLALGGSNDIANFFPQRARSPGYREKDRVENYLHDQVCSGAMTLAAAQRKIAVNWLTVYESLP